MKQTNDFGVELDSNGYAPSLLQHFPDRCYLCGRSDQKLDRHEIFHVYGDRDKSKALGLWVLLCHDRCHENGKEAVHKNAKKDLALKQIGELTALSYYGWLIQDFRDRFGKSYI